MMLSIKIVAEDVGSRWRKREDRQIYQEHSSDIVDVLSVKTVCHEYLDKATKLIDGLINIDTVSQKLMLIKILP